MTTPIYATFNSAAADLTAAEGAWIEPGEWAVIPTGYFGSQLFEDQPTNSVALICPRSGLAAKHGVTVLNAPGVIDYDYTDEVKVILINFGDTVFTVHKGMRIAQLLLTKRSVHFEFDVADTERVGGLGSTGD